MLSPPPSLGRERGSHDHYTQAKCHLSICFPFFTSLTFELQYNGYALIYSTVLQYMMLTKINVVSSEILCTYLALTKLSLDILASISAVSINNMDCLSKIVDMA